MNIDSIILIVSDFFAGLFGDVGMRLFPIYIATMILICFVIFLKRGNKGSFFGWLFPKQVYLHKSHMVDIKLFFFGHFWSLLGVINSVTFSTLAAVFTMHLISGGALAQTSWHPLVIGFVLLLASDFATYWVHRVHHETTPLWPFHAVHHSAEVLTPVTVFRKHPVYDIISTITHGLINGIAQGVLLALFVGNIELTTIAGVNAFIVLFNFFGANIRHSHVWLSYGRFVEHILISPAQHQIHHSSATTHWNKNYGEIFAVWDWMFGTLYVPKGQEDLKFGISDDPDFKQPHPTMRAALINPLKESWKALKP